MSVVRVSNFLRNPRRLYALACQRVYMSSDSQQPGWGQGSGAGGGSGGAIRDAGGAFGKRQAAKEEEYFRRLSSQQLDTLKESIHDEIKYHKEEIEDHQKAIQRHKKKLEDLEKLEK